jgi:hypothetical protein
MAVFWVVAPCRLVWLYQRFRGLYCLHHQGRRQPSSYSPPWEPPLIICTCKLWWHQYNVKNELFLVFVTENLTTEKQCLKCPITFSKTHKHSCNPKFCYQSVYCSIQYVRVRMRIAKFFTNSGKWFRSEVISGSEHTFCSLIRHVPICTSSRERRPIDWDGLDSSVTGEVNEAY